MTSAAARRSPLSIVQWRVLLLLVLSGFLNYIDRTNLSVGATDIQRDLHLTNYDLGLLGSGFFWTYALCQLSGMARTTGPAMTASRSIPATMPQAAVQVSHWRWRSADLAERR